MDDVEVRNDAMIRAFTAAWERRDADHIVDAFTEGGVCRSVPLTSIVGRSAIREFVEGFADVSPGRLEIRHQVAPAEVVMNECTDANTLNGEPPVLPNRGVFEFEDAGSRWGARTSTFGPARAAYATEERSSG